jgi:hypothetical protein
LRDYPRARYTNISTGAVDPSAVRVAVATFTLDPDDIAALHNIDPIVFADAKTWELTRYLDNQRKWWLPGVPDHRTFGQIENDLTRLKAHLGKQDGGGAVVDALAPLIANVTPNRKLVGLLATNLDAWLESALPVIDEDSERTLEQFGRIRQAVRWENVHKGAWKVLIARTPVFVYFSQIYSVRPRIHLTWPTWPSDRPRMSWTTSSTSAICACSTSSASAPRSCPTSPPRPHPRCRPTNRIRMRWRRTTPRSSVGKTSWTTGSIGSTRRVSPLPRWSERSGTTTR